MSDVPADSASTSAIVFQGRRADRSALANLLDQFRPALRAEARASLNPSLRKRADESDVAQMTLLTAVEEFAALWNELPLADNAVAARLGCTRQQVINLRMAARKRLGHRLEGAS